MTEFSSLPQDIPSSSEEQAHGMPTILSCPIQSHLLLCPLPSFYSQPQDREVAHHPLPVLPRPPPLPSVLIVAASILGKVWAMSAPGRGRRTTRLLHFPRPWPFQLVGGSDSTSPSPTLPLRNQRPLLAQNPRAGPCNCKLIIQQILLSPPSACGGPSAFCWLCMYGF